MKEIILASQSPRRKELLRQVGVCFRVCPADIEEHMDLSLPIEAAVEKLAQLREVKMEMQDTPAVFGQQMM